MCLAFMLKIIGKTENISKNQSITALHFWFKFKTFLKLLIKQYKTNNKH